MICVATCVVLVLLLNGFVVDSKEIRPAQEKATGQKSQGWAESQDRVGIGDY